MGNLAKIPAWQREELVSEAKAIINSRIWPLILEDMKEQAIHALIQAEPGTLTATAAHAKLKSLAELEGQLKSYLNDGLISKHNRGK